MTAGTHPNPGLKYFKSSPEVQYAFWHLSQPDVVCCAVCLFLLFKQLGKVRLFIIAVKTTHLLTLGCVAFLATLASFLLFGDWRLVFAELHVERSA